MSFSERNERPRARSLEFGQFSFTVDLYDGRTLTVPLEWFPRLREAAPEELKNWELVGRGIAIHWPTLDEDIGVAGLLNPERTLRPRVPQPN